MGFPTSKTSLLPSGPSNEYRPRAESPKSATGPGVRSMFSLHVGLGNLLQVPRVSKTGPELAFPVL